jgi:alpha-ribazole phosphatase
MEIYLVRHTETVCEKGICYGQADVEIATPYEAVFDAILKQLPQDALLFSSPLQRCTILAKHIQNNFAIANVTLDERLMEMNFGDWELKNWDSIPPDVFTPWMTDFVNVPVPNGESFLNLHNRVLDFMENALDSATTKPIVIVAHGGVIRSFLCAVSNLPLQDAFQNKVDFGAVVRLTL